MPGPKGKTGAGTGFAMPWRGPGKPGRNDWQARYSTEVRIPPPRVPPGLAYYETATWDVGSATKTVPISWNANDVIVVMGLTEANTAVIDTPTNASLSFSSIGTLINPSSSCFGHKWQATPVAGGSGSISCSLSGTGGASTAWGFSVWVGSGSDGVSNHGAVASTPNTQSFTTNFDDSAVLWGIADWGADAVPGSIDTIPVGATVRQAVQIPGKFTVYILEWPDRGTAGVTPYGITSLDQNENLTKLAVELRGTTYVAPNPTGWGMPIN